MIKVGFVILLGQIQFASDLYLEEASFMKLDNVTAGYVFDNFLGTKAKFRFRLVLFRTCLQLLIIQV